MCDAVRGGVCAAVWLHVADAERVWLRDLLRVAVAEALVDGDELEEGDTEADDVAVTVFEVLRVWEESWRASEATK